VADTCTGRDNGRTALAGRERTLPADLPPGPGRRAHAAGRFGRAQLPTGWACRGCSWAVGPRGGEPSGAALAAGGGDRRGGPGQARGHVGGSGVVATRFCCGSGCRCCATRVVDCTAFCAAYRVPAGVIAFGEGCGLVPAGGCCGWGSRSAAVDLRAPGAREEGSDITLNTVRGQIHRARVKGLIPPAASD
jgi:hypothetical protein